MVEAVTSQGVMVLDTAELSILFEEHSKLTALFHLRPWTLQEYRRIKELNRLLDSQEAHL